MIGTERMRASVMRFGMLKRGPRQSLTMAIDRPGRVAKRRAPHSAAFEQALQAILDEHRIDLVCLGGFMRLFTDDFVLRWQGRMLNIHPSLLPSFKGLDPHGQALGAGVKIAGASVHFVTPAMDAGP